jgi:alanyl-tRNA synthetase
MAELYDTTKFDETTNLYYNSHDLGFEAVILGILENQKDKKKRNIVVLDKSAFYPTSGG